MFNLSFEGRFSLNVCLFLAVPWSHFLKCKSKHFYTRVPCHIHSPRRRKKVLSPCFNGPFIFSEPQITSALTDNVCAVTLVLHYPLNISLHCHYHLSFFILWLDLGTFLWAASDARFMTTMKAGVSMIKSTHFFCDAVPRSVNNQYYIKPQWWNWLLLALPSGDINHDRTFDNNFLSYP